MITGPLLFCRLKLVGKKREPTIFSDIFQIGSQCPTRKRNNQNWESNGLLTNGPGLFAKREISFSVVSVTWGLRHALKTPFSPSSKKYRALTIANFSSAFESSTTIIDIPRYVLHGLTKVKPVEKNSRLSGLCQKCVFSILTWFRGVWECLFESVGVRLRLMQPLWYEGTSSDIRECF